MLLSPDDIETADTVVVLSGMVRPIKTNNDIYYEFTEAVDRVFAGINAIKSKKAQKIIFTRGKLPWSEGVPEGEFLAEFVKTQGLNQKQIILTEKVENTHDEAKAVSKLLPKNTRIILVTTAIHMPRAITVFQNQNLNVVPYAVDFRSSAKKLNLLSFLPQADAFKDTNMFFREIIGRAYYFFIKYF